MVGGASARCLGNCRRYHGTRWLVAAVALSMSACAGQSLAQQAIDAQTPHGFHYELRGRGGAPVVFVHGSGLDLHMWDDQVDSIAARFRVVRYDARGHGRTMASSAPQPAYLDLRDLLDDLGIRTVTIVGLSVGAQTAVDFALAYPGRVNRLVLASPTVSGYVPKGSFAWFAPIAAAARAKRYDEAARLYGNSMLLRIPDDSLAQSKLMDIVMANARVWADSTPQESMRPPSAIERLQSITVPTLIVVGERDIDDVHRIADMLSANLRCASRVDISSVGHMVNMAAPAQFTSIVLRFLQRSAAGCPST